MSNNPLEEQVGRIVGNVLAAGGAIYLPEVGSLCVERRRAQQLSRRTVRPPYRAVEFTSQQRGVSLVEEIARVLGTSGMAADEAGQTAREVYARWLGRAREGDTLTVSGVGVLRFKHFTLDEAFDRRLNPQGHAPVKVRPAGRPDWVIWLGAVAIVAAAGIGAYSYLTTRPEPKTETETAAVPAQTTSPEAAAGGDSVTMAPSLSTPVSAADGAAPATPSAATSSVAVPSSATPSVAEAPASAQASATAVQPAQESSARPAAASADEPARMTSKRSYVVLGVFSTPENAARAARNAASDDVAITCGVYRFGAKYLVSPFESDDPEACTLFIRAHAERFPGMWTYTAR
ncbi:MAG TPA: hypothetical protein IAA35_04900 [Candidatus Alistipes faecigallinarum]|nr:hypothetical protein [Candidatus Alistipes faecigallinarum]